MMRWPDATLSRTHAAVFSGSPMASSVSSERLGAPPCSGPISEPSAATTAAPRSAPVEMTARQTNVDALKPWSMPEDQVLLDGADELGLLLDAVDHPEVVGGVAEVVARRDRLDAAAQAVDGGDQRRHRRAQPQRFAAQFGAVDVERRRQVFGTGEQRDGGAQRGDRASARSATIAGSAVADRRRAAGAAARLRRRTPRARRRCGVRRRSAAATRLRSCASPPAPAPRTGGSGRSLRRRARRRVAVSATTTPLRPGGTLTASSPAGRSCASAMMSRIEMMPLSSSPTVTGMWR